MSSEPPFEHPPDHRRYDEPPLAPPRSMPWMLTAGFKSGCGAVLLFLLTQCCLCGTIGSIHDIVKKRFDAVDDKLNQINKKLDEANKKANELKKDDTKKEEPKKEDDTKKDDATKKEK